MAHVREEFRFRAVGGLGAQALLVQRRKCARQLGGASLDLGLKALVDLPQALGLAGVARLIRRREGGRSSTRQLATMTAARSGTDTRPAPCSPMSARRRGEYGRGHAGECNAADRAGHGPELRRAAARPNGGRATPARPSALAAGQRELEARSRLAPPELTGALAGAGRQRLRARRQPLEIGIPREHDMSCARRSTP